MVHNNQHTVPSSPTLIESNIESNLAASYFLMLLRHLHSVKHINGGIVIPVRRLQEEVARTLFLARLGHHALHQGMAVFELVYDAVGLLSHMTDGRRAVVYKIIVTVKLLHAYGAVHHRIIVGMGMWGYYNSA